MRKELYSLDGFIRIMKRYHLKEELIYPSLENFIFYWSNGIWKHLPENKLKTFPKPVLSPTTLLTVAENTALNKSEQTDSINLFETALEQIAIGRYKLSKMYTWWWPRTVGFKICSSDKFLKTGTLFSPIIRMSKSIKITRSVSDT